MEALFPGNRLEMTALMWGGLSSSEVRWCESSQVGVKSRCESSQVRVKFRCESSQVRVKSRCESSQDGQGVVYLRVLLRGFDLQKYGRIMLHVSR